VIGLLVGEIAVGLVLGLATRMVVAALQTAGSVIAQQLGLSFAMSVDPSMGGQQASIGNLVTLLGITLIFVTDLHHLAIAGDPGQLHVPAPRGRARYRGRRDAGDPRRGPGIRARGPDLGPLHRVRDPVHLGIGGAVPADAPAPGVLLAMPATILIGMVILLVALGAMMGVFITDLGRFLGELGRG
jgi:flagellar biosynthetic protein FliR